MRWLAKQVGPEVTAKRRSKKSTVATAAQSSGSGLLLVRSFDIPSNDPARERLADASYTYDNALATFAFLSVGAKSQAEQLLDQLKALQRTDGSIEYAFNVKTGTSTAQVRAGAMAWVGYAALAYKKVYDSTKYDTVIAGVARYLLTLRNAQGLIKGGPDVNWVSTQHNLLAAGFLRDLASKIGTRGTLGTGLSYTEINNAGNTLGNAILANLLVQEGPLAYFRQGVGDTKIPSDVQALGALYLQARGDGRAAQVARVPAPAVLRRAAHVDRRPALRLQALHRRRRARRDLVRGHDPGARSRSTVSSLLIHRAGGRQRSLQLARHDPGRPPPPGRRGPRLELRPSGANTTRGRPRPRAPGC